MPLYAPQSSSGLPTGTSFPLSPSANDLFHRTDRSITYYYDGTRWLSTNLLTISFNPDAVQPQTGSGGPLRAANPYFNLYDIYLTVVIVTSFNTAVTSTNYYSLQFQSEVGASSTAIGSAISGQNNTQNQYIGQTQTLNAVVPSTQAIFNFIATRTGTPSVYFTAAVQYRIIG